MFNTLRSVARIFTLCYAARPSTSNSGFFLWSEIVRNIVLDQNLSEGFVLLCTRLINSDFILCMGSKKAA